MFKNKGNLTFFIILGIILLITFILVIYASKDSILSYNPIDSFISSNTDSYFFNDYVNMCLKEVTENAILWIGSNGGYYNIKSFNNTNINYAYYLVEGKKTYPSKEIIQNEISDFINSEFDYCIEEFIILNPDYYIKKNNKSSSEIIILEKEISIIIDFPITIEKDGKTKNLRYFNTKINNIRLFEIYNIAKNITNDNYNNLGSICLSCIIDLGDENDVYIEINKIDNFSYLYSITDYNSIINDKPYIFRFAVKNQEFSCFNLPLDANYNLINTCIKKMVDETEYYFNVEQILKQTAFVNKEFNYVVNATGINISFIDFTNLFDINYFTGEINFIPSKENIGNHTIWLLVKDDYNEKHISFRMEIKDEK
jgi:hypothetical protein